MNPDLLQQIASTYGTPAYVYDAEIIEYQYDLLRNALPEAFEVFYSAKANPLLGICQLLRRRGSGIEVASEGELRLALAAGFSPQKILFTSPGKTTKELKYAIKQNIYCVNVESVEEARLIDEIARRNGRRVQVSIRVNSDYGGTGAGLRMSGVATQFGIDQYDVKEAADAILSLPAVRLIGVHVFSGTQVLDAGQIIRNMEETMKLAIGLSEACEFPLAFLDLGGGFGVPYFQGEEALDMAAFHQNLLMLWDDYKDRLAEVRIGVESGRFLLADSGVFMTKVLYVKTCRGHRYVICDGGSNQHASSAFLGRYVRNNFPMRVLGKHDSALEEAYVVGPLCTPTDVIGHKVRLPAVAPGDLLVVEKSGAYGLTHSPALFLSHALPCELLHDRGDVRILRETGKPEDVLRGQRALSETDREVFVR